VKSKPSSIVPRTHSVERQLRQTETILLVLTILTLCAGASLVLLAKNQKIASPKATSPKATSKVAPVNINRATAEEIAKVLQIPTEKAKQIVGERQKQDGFADVDSLNRLSSLVPRNKITAAYNNLAVRSWQEVQQTFLLCIGGIIGFLGIAHLLLRRFCPRADPFLLPVSVLLAGLGILLLFAIKDPIRDRLSFVGQTIGVLAGGTLAIFLPISGLWNRAPVHRYGYVYAVTAVVLTALLGILGSGPGGVRLSVAGMQPVEAIKILMVLFLAAYLAERGALLHDGVKKFGFLPALRLQDALPLLTLYALPLVLFALVRDLGPALLLFGVFLILLYLATARGIYVGLGTLVLLIGGYIGYRLRFGVFETRVNMWLSPWANNHSSGDHLVLGWWGLASGGIAGSGLGLGGSRFIPRAGSDLAFAAIGEEAGIFATITVLACFLTFAARGFRIAYRATTDFNRYIAAGLTALLVLQTVVLVGGTLGVLPLAGITLPFVSFGKSSLIASFVMIGILLSLSENNPTVPTQPLTSYRTAADHTMRFFALVLGLLCVFRVLYLQVFASHATAGRNVITPDADKVRRPHINPRLLALANEIPRGKLLDRNGNTLAVTQNGKRFYPYGSAFAHLIGYADPTVGGPTGLEAEFSTQLRGFERWADLVILWQTKDLPGFQLPEGNDVALTVSAELQKETLAILKRRAERIKDRKTGRPKNRGAAVVLEVATGEVLAAVTLPVFDPNQLTPNIMAELNADVNNDYPLINRALSGYYPPGSTFKVVTAAAQLEQDYANFTARCSHTAKNLLWKANGATYARKRITDDESESAHGLVNLTEAIAESCNVYFARAGIALGGEKLRQTATLFGFGKLPAEALFAQELPDIAYGQGPLLVTPCEMASVTATIANGGERIPPHVRKGTPRNVASRPLTRENAYRLVEMMRQVVTRGTAVGKFSQVGMTVAGKTGTAQNDRYDRMSHSWFIGFAPVEEPKYAIAVIVENGGYGASAAVPIAAEVLAHLPPN